MPLEEETLLLDDLGIFPRKGETQETFQNRGWSTLTVAQKTRDPDSDWFKKTQEEFEEFMEKEKIKFTPLEPITDERMRQWIREIQCEFRRRFDTNLRWVPIFRAMMGRPGTGYLGLAEYADHTHNDAVLLTHSRIILDTSLRTRRAFQSNLPHECIHIVQQLPGYFADKEKMPEKWKSMDVQSYLMIMVY